MRSGGRGEATPQGGTYTVHTPVGYERFTLSADQTQSLFFHWCP